MSGRSSRMKGAASERDVANILRAAGFDASRNRIGVNGDDLITAVPGVSFEVKRQETLCIPAWLRQCEEQAAKSGAVPVLVFRRSREPWRAVIPFEHYVWLLQIRRDAENAGV